MSESTEQDRNRIVALFALVGAAFGVLVAMLCFAAGDSGYGRVSLDFSAPLTFVTTIFGASAGASLSRASHTGRILAAGVLILTALLGAVMGWLVGSALEHTPVSPGRAMATGVLAGLLVGALVLVPRWLRRTRD